MNALMRWCRKSCLKLNDFVYQSEGEEIKEHLSRVWSTMKNCVEIGLQGKGVLPGGLNLPRKARDMFRAAQRSNDKMGVFLLFVRHCSETPICLHIPWRYLKTMQEAKWL